MLTPAIRLKEQLATNSPVVGLMATDHAWPSLVEICQRAGLDYLVIDCEHGSFSDELVAHICQIGRLADFPVFVRAISSKATVIRRIIDLGPCGILIPNVESTSELDQVRKAIFMPPHGRRRPGGMGNHWVSNFEHETWQTEFEDHFIVIPQIESQRGVNQVNEIAGHDIVTALGLGPYDLSADLGCCWDPDDADFQNALSTVKAAADAEGKKVWAGCDGPALRAQGYTFLWVGTASVVLTSALSGIVDAIRSSDPLTSAAPETPPPA